MPAGREAEAPLLDPRRWPHMLWWSFYAGDASFARFLANSLAYLQRDPRTLGGRQQVDALLAALRRPGLLLLLAGFDCQLRACAGPPDWTYEVAYDKAGWLLGQVG